MSSMTPQEIVHELDKHIVGQAQAKRAVAIALRNRWRRQQVAEPLRQEITPKNILMIGPTGVGKTEIARRLARLAQAPFLKVEATKFTEVGYVGRDVESIARDLLVRINQAGVPAGCEFLDVISPQYIGDLVSWGAIGARTTESQVHRELASGLSAAVGFKNGTDGNVRIAVDAILAARQKHHFLSVHKSGQVAIVETRGNDDCHIILRGGRQPNYDAASVRAACEELRAAGLAERLMIDLSHANSYKDYRRQGEACRDVAGQLAGGQACIVGVMIESHLVAGRQDLVPGRALVFGQSITDACLGWEDSVALLEELAEAVRRRRAAAPAANGAD